MKTFTIAAVALLATFGPLAGQTQRSERAARERAAVRQQIEELEARYRRMMAELPRHENDRDYLRALREIEETLQHAQLELRGVEVHEQPRVEAEMRALERAIQEHELRIAEAGNAREHALREALVERSHAQELRQREQLEHLDRARREAAEVEAPENVHERARLEDIERALNEAQAAQERLHVDERARLEEVEHALRASENAVHREQLERMQSEHVEQALRETEQALARQRNQLDRQGNRMDRSAHEALAERELAERLLATERALHEADQVRNRDRIVDQRMRRENETVIQRMRERRLFEDFDADAELDRLYRDGPRASWARQDPADSVWRAARDQMNRRDYETASRLFARIHTQERYRRSDYRADALYWHAFALNRVGTRDAVRESLELLERLIREYPEADRHADTNGLLTTVQVRLAEMGNLDARQQVRATAVDEARVATNVQSIVRADVARSAEVAVTLPPERIRAESSQRADRVTQLDAIVALPTEYGDVRVVDGVVVSSPTDARIATWGLPANRLTSLSPQCAREESEIQLIALNSLVRMDTAAAMPVLREVMARRDGCSAPLRQSAMTIIARIRNAEADRILTEAARSDPDTGVRRTALVYLSSRNEEQAVGIAADALRTAGDAEEQQWALQALARMRTDRAWSVVRDYAARSDLPADTRRSAIAILSGSNDSTNTAFLRGLYGQVGNDRQLKEAILMSSAFRRGALDPDWLFTIAQDGAEDDRIREYAVMALSRNDDVGTPRFVVLYDRTEDKRLKLALLRVLADRAESESAAVDKLISIARTEDDTDLRKTAVLGLPANDPRARELLLEILRGM